MFKEIKNQAGHLPVPMQPNHQGHVRAPTPRQKNSGASPFGLNMKKKDISADLITSYLYCFDSLPAFAQLCLCLHVMTGVKTRSNSFCCL